MSGLLAISDESADFFWRHGREASPGHVHLPFAAAARREEDGAAGYHAASVGEPAGDATETSGETAVTVANLGAHLASWEDRDLLKPLLRAFFAAAREALPADARDLAFQPCHPPWMGPRERRRLAVEARAAGVALEVTGWERGIALALVAARHHGTAPGGWLIADRCGSDLDLYSVDVEPGGELVPRSYRRLGRLFSSYFVERESQVADLVKDAVGRLESGRVRVAGDDATAAFLAQALDGAPVDAATLADLLSTTSSEVGLAWVPRRPGRLWLDHGDERLVSLSESDDTPPLSRELLFEIPQPAPPGMRLAVRAGLAPTREETHALCAVQFLGPREYLTAPGHLLVRVEIRERSLELAVEVLQNGERINAKTERFDYESRDPA